jgi:hypothetical protein
MIVFSHLLKLGMTVWLTLLSQMWVEVPCVTFRCKLEEPVCNLLLSLSSLSPVNTNHTPWSV